MTNQTNQKKMKNKIPTAKELSDAVRADSIGKSNGLFVFRRGFFYTNGKDASDYEAQVLRDIANYFPAVVAVPVEAGQVYRPFKGGAGVARSSHWFVKVRLSLRATATTTSA